MPGPESLKTIRTSSPPGRDWPILARLLFAVHPVDSHLDVSRPPHGIERIHGQIGKDLADKMGINSHVRFIIAAINTIADPGRRQLPGTEPHRSERGAEPAISAADNCRKRW